MNVDHWRRNTARVDSASVQPGETVRRKCLHPGRTKELTIVIPALNEQEKIAETIEACCRWRAICSTILKSILIDDGSTDDTGAIMDRFAAEEPRIRRRASRAATGRRRRLQIGLAAREVRRHHVDPGRSRLPESGHCPDVQGRRRSRYRDHLSRQPIGPFAQPLVSVALAAIRAELHIRLLAVRLSQHDHLSGEMVAADTRSRPMVTATRSAP